MKTNKILLLDYLKSGQPENVLQSWLACFAHKGIADCVDTGTVADLVDDNQAHQVVILSSVPSIGEKDIKSLAEQVASGRSLILTGPVGSAIGLHPLLQDLAGTTCDGVLAGERIPLVEQCIGMYERNDALLFLRDKGVLPSVTPNGARILATSMRWMPQTEKYVRTEDAMVLAHRGKGGKVIYCSCAVGDRERISLLRAGEAAPGWNVRSRYSVGSPEYSDLNAAEKEFMFGLLFASGCSTVSVGHWPNGWRLVASLTGDLHEDGQYVNIQCEGAVDMAAFLEEEGLGGLFTFSITGKALEEHRDMMRDFKKRGYEAVPHSAYRAHWFNEIELDDQIEQIDKCLEVFKESLPPESRLGWRSHGWSADEHTERLLDERGVIWLANLLAQRYGDFGPMDTFVRDANGIAFQCLPEKPDGLSILRFPHAFSPDWVRTMIGQEFYGVTEGLSADNAMVDFMKHRFMVDWRLESHHLVDWHPWEEFIAEPIFRQACRELVHMFKETRHTAVVQPTDVARWWRFREKVAVREVALGENHTTHVKLSLPANDIGMNPTLRLSRPGWQLDHVTINGTRDWRFFGRNWTALPLDISGDVEVEIQSGCSQDPQIRDSTAMVSEARMDGVNMAAEIEELWQQRGRVSLYLPKRSTVTLDGKNTGNHAGYHIIPITKGKHSILVEPRNRRLTPEDFAASPEP